MLKSCKYCGRIHDSKLDCGRKPKRTKQNNEKDRFRSSRVWQKKRRDIRRRDLNLCRVCMDNGQYVYDDLEVHHITPLEVDFSLRLEDENLITLCEPCHEMAEQGEIEAEYLRRLANRPPGGCHVSRAVNPTPRVHLHVKKIP